MCDKMNKPVWAIIQGVYQKVCLDLDGGDDSLMMVITRMIIIQAMYQKVSSNLVVMIMMIW